MSIAVTSRHKLIFRLFAKRMMRYALVLAALGCILVPMVRNTYDMAKTIVVEASMKKLRQGIFSLEKEIQKTQDNANMIAAFDEYTRLNRVRGMPDSSYYLDITSLQSKMANLGVTQDYATVQYLMFRNTPIFVSNLFATDDYQKVYPSFLSIENESAEAWRNNLLGHSSGIHILAEEMLQISPMYGKSYLGLACIMSISLHGQINPNGAFVAVFDSNKIISDLLDEEQRQTGFVYLANQSDRILLRDQYAADVGTLDTLHEGEFVRDGDTYMILRSGYNKYGLEAVCGINVTLFNSHVRSQTNLAYLYILIGTAVAIALSLLFAIRESLRVGRVVAAVSQTPQMPPVKDEYRFIDGAIQDIRWRYEQQNENNDLLTGYVRKCVLENILLNGGYSAKDRDDMRRYFGNEFAQYIVVVLQANTNVYKDIHTRSDEHVLKEIETSFGASMQQRIAYISLNMEIGESVFFLFLPSAHPDESAFESSLQAYFHEMVQKHHTNIQFNIGISGIAHDIANARETYAQAKKAIRQGWNQSTSGIYHYHSIVMEDPKHAWDYARLAQYGEIILTGEAYVVDTFFQNLHKELPQATWDAQECMQLFFSFRQQAVGTMALLQIKGNDPRAEIALPTYAAYIEAAEILEIYHKHALALSAIAAERRTSNNKVLQENIIAFIHENYRDPNLSASMIATSLSVCEKYIYTIIKEATGDNLGKYIEKLRVREACDLLLSTNHANAVISSLCGFGSEKTFYRAFSKHHGVSPNVWRSSQKTRV